MPQATINREDFLRLCGIKSVTFDQRMFSGEAALALGCERPAERGKYLMLDAVAMILASMLNCYTGLTLRQAAEVVREHWDGWLTLVTKVERWPYPFDPMLFIAVAHLDAEHYRVLFGELDQIKPALAGETVAGLSFLSIARVLHQFRVNAEHAGIIPERLTVADDEPGYVQWHQDIGAYREAAGVHDKPAKPLVKA